MAYKKRNNRKEGSERLVSEPGIELMVWYTYEEEIQIEECHGPQRIEYTDVELDRVCLTIADEDIEILGKLSEAQKDELINQLSIY